MTDPDEDAAALQEAQALVEAAFGSDDVEVEIRVMDDDTPVGIERR